MQMHKKDLSRLAGAPIVDALQLLVNLVGLVSG